VVGRIQGRGQKYLEEVEEEITITKCINIFIFMEMMITSHLNVHKNKVHIEVKRELS
jgi:hypothetical protein